MVHPKCLLMIGTLSLLAAVPVAADEAQATLVAGLLVADPSAAVEEFARGPSIGDDQQFFIAWSHPLDEPPDESVNETVRSAGATPWT